jgi:uncharacterized protein (TIGR02996 family)
MKLHEVDHGERMVRSLAMSELAKLHADVLANPDADEPRIAYADAVAKTDPPRAEIIRVQLEITRKLRDREDASRDAYRRQQILLDKHRDAWTKDVVAVPGVHWAAIRRGFPEHVEMSAADFLAHGDQLFARAPIRHLDLSEVYPHASSLFQSPLLRRIRSLNLRGTGLGDYDARALAASPHVDQLVWLELGGNRIGEEGLEALVGSRHLTTLRYLGFARNGAPDPTPQVGESDDSGNARYHDITDAARAFEARFGKRPWLVPDFREAAYPPDREAI